MLLPGAYVCDDRFFGTGLPRIAHTLARAHTSNPPTHNYFTDDWVSPLALGRSAAAGS